MELQNGFAEVAAIIRQARSNALRAVNTELIRLYWEVGAYISDRVARTEWGKPVVEELAAYLQRSEQGLKDFSDKNLWRMKQFYEAYKESPALLALAQEVGWSHNLAVFSRCKSAEERAFYLQLCKREHYTFKELDRQISAALYERSAGGGQILSTPLRELHPDAGGSFRDAYVLEFLNLPEPYSERDLQRGLIAQTKTFILELGRDFLFVGEEYPLQVGARDFYTDLLFYHRGLQCLVAFELKRDSFQPEHLGKLSFYLEALDRDVKKPNENPSIGVLLCKDHDREIVEYAMARNLSPALVAQYTLMLPDKALLQSKLHELLQGADDNI